MIIVVIVVMPAGSAVAVIVIVVAIIVAVLLFVDSSRRQDEQLRFLSVDLRFGLVENDRLFLHGDPSSLRILASGFSGESGVPMPLAISADGSELYFFEISGIVSGIDAEGGTSRVIGDLTEFFYFAAPTGITVYAPLAATGSCCADGSGVCTNDVTQATCEGSARRYVGDGTDCGTIDPPCSQSPECGDDLVNPSSEECDGSDDAACQGQCQANCTCPAPPVTGRCCLSDGRCEITTRAQCDSQAGDFGGAGTSCEGDSDGNEIDDACEGVPAVSAWGIMILVLVMLTGIAIKFGFQRRPSCGYEVGCGVV